VLLLGWNLAASSYFLALNVQPNQVDMHGTYTIKVTLAGNN